LKILFLLKELSSETQKLHVVKLCKLQNYANWEIVQKQGLNIEFGLLPVNNKYVRCVKMKIVCGLDVSRVNLQNEESEVFLKENNMNF
jgi:hypothetical protein